MARKNKKVCGKGVGRSMPSVFERQRNRASPTPLVKLYPDLNEGQIEAIENMDLESMINIKCHELNNPLINWLAPKYDMYTRELVISSRDRIPIIPESVYRTLKLPHGDTHVPYEADPEVVGRLAPALFPDLGSIPKICEVYKVLKVMKESGNGFKQVWLMYLVSTLLSPSTCNRVSKKCYAFMDKFGDAKTMNWCQFVCDRLHEELCSGKPSGGCLFHLQLLYVDSLDISSLNLNIPNDIPEGSCVCNIWTKKDVDIMVAADLKRDGSRYGTLQFKPHVAINLNYFGGPIAFDQWIATNTAQNCRKQRQEKVSRLIGEFASGIYSLMGKLVQGWTETDEDDDVQLEEAFGELSRGVGIGGNSRETSGMERSSPIAEAPAGSGRTRLRRSRIPRPMSSVPAPEVTLQQGGVSENLVE